jgi:predicted transposase YbfD/YdcC
MNWQLDVSVDEDACRIRQKNSTENLAKVRHVGLNMLKTHGSLKGGNKKSINK